MEVLELILGPNERFYALKIAYGGKGGTREEIVIFGEGSLIDDPRMQMVMATLTAKCYRMFELQELLTSMISSQFDNLPNE